MILDNPRNGIILTPSFKQSSFYVAWTVGIEIKAFVTCRHEVCVMVNASANTPNELVEHVWENVVLPIITERV